MSNVYQCYFRLDYIVYVKSSKTISFTCMLFIILIMTIGTNDPGIFIQKVRFLEKF